MTVIRPNSISGVTSITALQNSIEFYKSDGSLSGANIDGISINTAGIITATAFHGSGSGLTGVSGLGTALSNSGILKDIFYFDKTMSVSSNTTVNPPASASTAYTHFTEVKIEDGVDLIIEDGDSLVIDVLGLVPS
tara:strand:+ start:308 stop:715 length:408 start_codon:yes stop_codon:yes gene_type:complete